MICEFSEPINLGSTTESWAFSKLECGNPSTTELIINPDYPERSFYISKTLDLGEALIIFFLTLGLIIIIAQGVFNFFWKK